MRYEKKEGKEDDSEISQQGVYDHEKESVLKKDVNCLIIDMKDF